MLDLSVFKKQMAFSFKQSLGPELVRDSDGRRQTYFPQALKEIREFKYNGAIEIHTTIFQAN